MATPIEQNWYCDQFYCSRIEVLKIAQLLALVIFVSVSLVREILRGFERKFKTQNPNLSQSLTTDEFDAFWKEADSNGDGKLDYEEFIKMMRQY